MDNYLEYLVQDTDITERIDKFLSQRESELSRSTIQKLIEESRVFVNGNPVKSSYKVKKGDLIEITDIDVFDWDIVPQKMDLDIVYEDNDVLVVNKPSGLVVHPAPGHYTDTLVNGLMYHINQLSDVNGEERPGIVHRIDKDTSGLLMIAKTNKAHNILAEELKQKETKREYIALVEGVIKNKRGKINAPIGRDPRNRLKMAVIANGRPAVTHFEVLETFQQKSLIKCILETGRTHQIRVHMAYIGNPLAGDHVYGSAKNTDFGQFLHAKTLGFTHPITKEFMEFDSPLPQPFLDELEQLRNQ
ncbi:MAG: RluA family pseudouridine synthase [Bacilli bacterium]|nr:RluA family pseudouridine synthase [Bacilli bacterium]MBN2877486.1 RluA family pseudouridine synthase [Bacilli bacterium]